MIKTITKLEGIVVFLFCLYFYNQLESSWLMFVLLWIVPDVSMVGYLKNSKLGAMTYNLAHNFIASLLLVALGIFLENSIIISLGIIWTSHVALDRFLGFGLKYENSFKETHVQKL